MEIEAKVLNIVTAIQYVQSAIISKIQNTTKDYQTIRGKLQGRVSLPNGGVVIDPLSSNNLYGLRYLLFKNYGKVDMVICCKMLLNLLSFEFPESTCRDNPEMIVSEFNRALKQWKQLKLSNKYMDDDKLFSIALVKSIHPKADLRPLLIKEILEVARSLEFNNGIQEFMHDTPIFTKISTWIESIYSKTKSMNENSLKKLGIGGSTSGNTQNFSSNSSNFQSKFQTPKGTERAAAAITGNGDFKEARGPYNREITRADWIGVKNLKDGRVNLYTATTSVCPKCVSKNLDFKCSKPYCFIRKCQRCLLWGHKSEECLQLVDHAKLADEEVV
jgi:hypothetical protein